MFQLLVVRKTHKLEYIQSRNIFLWGILSCNIEIFGERQSLPWEQNWILHPTGIRYSWQDCARLFRVLSCKIRCEETVTWGGKDLHRTCGRESRISVDIPNNSSGSSLIWGRCFEFNSCAGRASRGWPQVIIIPKWKKTLHRLRRVFAMAIAFKKDCIWNTFRLLGDLNPSLLVPFARQHTFKIK